MIWTGKIFITLAVLNIHAAIVWNKRSTSITGWVFAIILVIGMMVQKGG